jgi:hypothetical protein
MKKRDAEVTGFRMNICSVFIESQSRVAVFVFPTPGYNMYKRIQNEIIFVSTNKKTFIFKVYERSVQNKRIDNSITIETL